jgi:ABC-type lipoprotein release transport system permease subunit
MLKLAYRNLWRNRRRTLITVASVFFALFFSAVMHSYMDGMWGQMIANTLRTQAGHIEIHGAGYWDDKIIDNFMTMDSVAIQQLRALPNVENVSPRVETFALVSFENISKGVAVIAVSPVQENAKSKLSSHVIEGAYLTENDNGVLIGEGLAKYLKVSVGDTLAFVGQGYQGASAAGLFPVRGIMQLALTEMNNSMVYITLPAVQTFIDLPNGYSGILITLKDDGILDETKKGVAHLIEKTRLSTSLQDEYAVYDWHFTMQRLLQTAESDKAFNKFVLFILYLIVGFGILGTVIMLTNERKREFRMLVSLGMQRSKLAATLCLELLIMGLLGIISGIAVALPLAFYFHAYPIQLTSEVAKTFNDMGMEAIIPFSVEPKIFITQVAIVFIIIAIATIYPIRKIRILKLTGQ